MSLVKAQLRAFYAAQGLTGKHRRKAMQHDMKQVKKLRESPNDVSLICLFTWGSSPQEVFYWHARHTAQTRLTKKPLQ